jgi:hypothetical protein
VTKALLWVAVITGAAALVGAAVVGTLYATDFWDDEEPVRVQPQQEAPRGPRLTAGEARTKANAVAQKRVTAADAPGLFATCATDDYNAQTEKWIVVCTFSRTGLTLDYRYEVDDRTGRVSPID